MKGKVIHNNGAIDSTYIVCCEEPAGAVAILSHFATPKTVITGYAVLLKLATCYYRNLQKANGCYNIIVI